MKTHVNDKPGLRKHVTVSPDEIFAAGGTTAFGIKSGKNNETLKKALNGSPEPEQFTEEEWTDLMKQLARDK
jgi:hypothetical protein